MRVVAKSVCLQRVKNLFSKNDTVEPRYNEVLGTMEITLLYQVSHYIRVKNKEI